MALQTWQHDASPAADRWPEQTRSTQDACAQTSISEVAALVLAGPGPTVIPLSGLVDETLTRALMYLPLQSVVALQVTNKAFSAAVSHDDVLWTQLLHIVRSTDQHAQADAALATPADCRNCGKAAPATEAKRSLKQLLEARRSRQLQAAIRAAALREAKMRQVGCAGFPRWSEPYFGFPFGPCGPGGVQIHGFAFDWP
eukprot:TRINITY_DN21249_c0_g1_i1.p1 TRINITY_DN21249_c0_g1~~TRINITY_DN21249_c0_g1_i1.p1  ORF type:complete len:199 (+),score=27.54 TRINITY_DN21249_c0_g1_i1:100-696(+)